MSASCSLHLLQQANQSFSKPNLLCNRYNYSEENIECTRVSKELFSTVIFTNVTVRYVTIVVAICISVFQTKSALQHFLSHLHGRDPITLYLCILFTSSPCSLSPTSSSSFASLSANSTMHAPMNFQYPPFQDSYSH